MDNIINTPCGKIKGVNGKNKNTIAFKGIRYAIANRFEYPRQVTHWEGIYDASHYGHCCYQPRSFYNEEENLKKVFYYNEFRRGETYSYSEDCLFLNIFTPSDIKEGDNLPVIVYIHGGGFKGGCGHEKQFDEPVWPQEGVIGVTINYRLGPLGFMALEELKDDIGRCGNYGLYDQVCAINWVKDNIHSFGGNPNNITIMGQSAGAMSIQSICSSPVTKGLFNKAVMNSGGGVNKILRTHRPEKYYAFNKKVMEFSNCASINELKTLPIEKLYEAIDLAKKEIKIMGMIYCPVIDDYLITDTQDKILKNNKQHHISYMMGSTSEDMMAPFMNIMSRNWCKKQKEDCYTFFFNHQLPGDKHGAWHSSELWYFFGTLSNCWRPMNEIDYTLSNTMVKYLSNFAKTGNPNSQGLPEWNSIKTSKEKDMHLGNGFIGMKKTKRAKMWYKTFTTKPVGE